MRTPLVALLSLAACATASTGAPVARSAAPAAPMEPPAAAPSPAEPGHALPFLEDDLPRAMRQARERKVPLFVDAWASW